MQKEILIPSSHVKYLIPAYKQRISEIDELVNSLALERSELASVIAKYAATEGVPIGEAVPAIVFPDGYDPNWTWFLKAKFILKQFNRPLTNAQIIEEILKREPNMDKKKALNSMSATLVVKSSSQTSGLTKNVSEGSDQTYSLQI